MFSAEQILTRISKADRTDAESDTLVVQQPSRSFRSLDSEADI